MAIPENFANREIETISRLYRNSEARLMRVIQSATATDFQRGRSWILLKQIQTILTELEAGHQRWAEQNVIQWYRRGMAETAKTHRQPLPAFTQIHRQAVEALVQRMVATSAERVQSVAVGVSSAFIGAQQRVVQEQALAAQIAEGVIEGLGPEELSKRIVQTLQDGAVRRLGTYVDPVLKQQLQQTAEGKLIHILCKDGKTRAYNLKDYGRMVGITESRFAASEGVMKTTLEYGEDLVQWSVHTGACAICLPLQGKVFSITGQNKDFPILTDDSRCPAHPKCRHCLAPVVESFLRDRGQYDALRQFSNAPEARVNDFAAFRERIHARAA
ncbi:MAG: phage minor capsid protein [bacterium]